MRQCSSAAAEVVQHRRRGTSGEPLEHCSREVDRRKRPVHQGQLGSDDAGVVRKQGAQAFVENASLTGMVTDETLGGPAPRTRLPP